MSIYTPGTRHFSRLVRAGFYVLAMCSPIACDRTVPSDVAGPIVHATPISIGSVITSSVITTTTICRATGPCHTATANSRISEKVGLTTDQVRLASALSSNRILPVDGEQFGSLRIQTRGRNVSGGALGTLKNIRVSGATLSADAIKNGRRWHLEFTRDPVAKGKISAVRFSLDGKLLITSNAKWEDVQGAWYRRHSDLTFYHEGKAALHQEKSFSPISIRAGTASDHLSPTITLKDVYEIDPSDGGCPFDLSICEFFQSNNPLPILDGAVSGLGWVAVSIGNFFNGLWAGAESDATIGFAETAGALMEAWTEPSLLNLAEAVVTLGSGPVTDTLLEQIASDILEWLTSWIWFTL